MANAVHSVNGPSVSPSTPAAGSTLPSRPARHVLLLRLAGAGAVLVLLAGCSIPSGAWRNPVNGLNLLPPWMGSKTSEESFVRAVENDPFPKANRIQTATSNPTR
jgi:hypothetical protein